jgi:hypothetical protein
VLHVILAGTAGIAPGRLREFEVIGMDGIKPAQAEAFLNAKACKFYPLRAAPSAQPSLRVRKTRYRMLVASNRKRSSLSCNRASAR